MCVSRNGSERPGSTERFLLISRGCDMDQDRILDKIKKCLEMAKGRGSNPNEAEIALRH
ncbi:DUF2786 domain-containing protein, partial [Pseudomonas sp. 17072548]